MANLTADDLKATTVTSVHGFLVNLGDDPDNADNVADFFQF